MKSSANAFLFYVVLLLNQGTLFASDLTAYDPHKLQHPTCPAEIVFTAEEADSEFDSVLADLKEIGTDNPEVSSLYSTLSNIRHSNAFKTMEEGTKVAFVGFISLVGFGIVNDQFSTAVSRGSYFRTMNHPQMHQNRYLNALMWGYRATKTLAVLEAIAALVTTQISFYGTEALNWVEYLPVALMNVSILGATAIAQGLFGYFVTYARTRSIATVPDQNMGRFIEFYNMGLLPMVVEEKDKAQFKDMIPNGETLFAISDDEVRGYLTVGDWHNALFFRASIFVAISSLVYPFYLRCSK